ncbi:MAG: winged helix-turn-helix domain-containing protein [Thermoplasmata archaeon]
MEEEINNNHLMKNRDRGDLVFDILKELYTADGQIGLTKLIYKVNTNYVIARDIINMLSENGLLEKSFNKNKASLKVTEKGAYFLKAYERVGSAFRDRV